MDPHTKFILIASFGSACQEFFYWWELRNKLQNIKYKKLIKSLSYWLLVSGMIIISGLGTYFFFFEEEISKMQIPFIIGAAFPVLFKKAVQARGAQDLGNEDQFNIRNITKTYFQQ